MKKSAFALAIAVAFAAPAFAQSKSDWDKIVLEEAQGSVMTSTGCQCAVVAQVKQQDRARGHQH